MSYEFDDEGNDNTLRESKVRGREFIFKNTTLLKKLVNHLATLSG